MYKLLPPFVNKFLFLLNKYFGRKTTQTRIRYVPSLTNTIVFLKFVFIYFSLLYISNKLEPASRYVVSRTSRSSPPDYVKQCYTSPYFILRVEVKLLKKETV